MNDQEKKVMGKANLKWAVDGIRNEYGLTIQETIGALYEIITNLQEPIVLELTDKIYKLQKELHKEEDSPKED